MPHSQHSDFEPERRQPLAACEKPIDELAALCRGVAERATLSGYGEFVCSASALHCADTSRMNHVRGELPTEIGVWAELFYFGGDVSKREADAALGADVVEGLRRLGVLCERDEVVRSANLMLRRVAGLWYLHEAPSPNPGIYFGDDSVALMWRCAARQDDRVLDLCTGPGLQLLHAVRSGGHGIGVDVNPIALGIAEVNARLNGLEDRVGFRCEGVESPKLASEGPFDLLLANPPLLPFAADEGYPFVGHGGPDGMDVTWRILDSLPELLSYRGSAQIIGTTLSDGFALSPEPRLRRWAKDAAMDVLLSVTSQSDISPQTPLFRSMVATAEAASGRPSDTLGAAFEASNHRLGGSHLAGFFLRVRRGSGRIDVMDTSRFDSSTFFFV